MKKLLLASVVFIGLADAAKAEVPTFDAANALAQAKSYLQDIKSYLVEIQTYTTELQTYYTDAQMLAGFVHDPNLGAVMGLANMLGVGSSIPVNLYAVQGLVSGYGGMTSFAGLSGKLSNLGSLANGSWSNDNVYTCTTNSFSCAQSNAQMAGAAGTKGLVSNIVQDMQNHLPVIQGLRERLASAGNPKDVADIQGQLAVEQNWVNNEQGQLQAVALLNQAQQQVDGTQRVQKQMSDGAALRASMPN